MCIEENLQSVDLVRLCDSLVGVLGAMVHSGEILLLACRSVSNLLEALPASARLLERAGCIAPLVQQLTSVEFVDVGELAVSALNKLSLLCAPALLNAGVVDALLAFIDFFSEDTQRAALQCLRNMALSAPM